MTILITGGLGFIGHELAESFENEKIIIIDNRRDDIGEFRELCLRNGLKRKLTVLHKDILYFNLSPHRTEKLKDVDAIIHCAAQTAVTKSLENPTNDFRTNAEGTFLICELARKLDSQLIYTSTNKVYGENVNKIAIKEDPTRYEFVGGYQIDETFPIDLTGHTPYGVSKLAGDLYVQDYARTYGLKTVVFRMSCVTGSSQTGTEDQGWVSHIVKNAVRGEPINIFGNGKQVRDILYVDDLVDLFHLALSKNISGVFNIGGGRNNTISVLELLKMLPETTLIFKDWRPMDQKVYVSNINKAINVYGWSPKISLVDGIKRLVSSENLIKNSVMLE